MDKSELKRKVCAEIDRHKDEIAAIAEKILASPEMGYREYKTAELVKETLSSLGIPYTDGLAVTGVMGRLSGRDTKARVAVIGELDAVTCSSHPKADRISGAAHACGHNAQIAAMLGSAMGLMAVAGELDGEVDFLAAPAEEYVEIGYRESLRERGEIDFFGGKQELIRTGVFDGIDMAMMVHAQGATPENELYIGGSSLGFVAKKIDFIGKAAHAAAAPHEGVNALNAAMAAMMCIHAQRETFRDEDRIRIHPIITNGGELVNVVPSRVTMETYVRGASLEAISDASEKVDRAIDGASYAIGAKCEIKNYKGYLPLIQSEELSEIFAENSQLLDNPPRVIRGVPMTASTDIGDLGYLIPIIQPMMGGFVGNLHSADFAVADEELAYINPAKIMAMTVIDLLSDGAKGAIAVKESFKPRLTKEEYINC
ncbi:MAG: amidohydrolase [Clostridia bacterium]|nr:amidohydrolase [Clostridia bacterium]MBP3582440.1 amidohydrolase [Clostridia bacterium]